MYVYFGGEGMTKKDLLEAETAVEQGESSVKKTPEEARKEWLDSVNAELELLRHQISSSEDSVTSETQSGNAFQSTIVGIQELVGTPLGEKTKEVIYANTVETSVKRRERQQERIQQLQQEKLHALLLTQDEEGREIEVQRENAYAKKEFRNSENVVVLRGTSHTSTFEKRYTVNKVGEAEDEMVQNLENVYQELISEKPTILMHEGKGIHEIFSGMSEEEIRKLDPAFVVSKSELVYLPWRAFLDGIETKSWDLPMAEQFAMLLKSADTSIHPKHTPEAIQAWLASTALRKLYEKKETLEGKDLVLNEEILKEILKYVVSEEEQKSLRTIGIDCDASAILKALESFSGKTTEELFRRFNVTQERGDDFSVLRPLTEPRKNPGEMMGPTNWVLYDANHLRDVRAMDVLMEEKKKHTSIAMLAGASHIITWEPAVKESYKQEEKSE